MRSERRDRPLSAYLVCFVPLVTEGLGVPPSIQLWRHLSWTLSRLMHVPAAESIIEFVSAAANHGSQVRKGSQLAVEAKTLRNLSARIYRRCQCGGFRSGFEAPKGGKQLTRKQEVSIFTRKLIVTPRRIPAPTDREFLRVLTPLAVILRALEGYLQVRAVTKSVSDRCLIESQV